MSQSFGLEELEQAIDTADKIEGTLRELESGEFGPVFECIDEKELKDLFHLLEALSERCSNLKLISNQVKAKIAPCGICYCGKVIHPLNFAEHAHCRPCSKESTEASEDPFQGQRL